MGERRRAWLRGHTLRDRSGAVDLVIATNDIMEIEVFQDYCSKMAGMQKEVPDWYKWGSGIISDYLRNDCRYGFNKVLYKLLPLAYRLIASDGDRGDAAKQGEDIYGLAAQLSIHEKVEGYEFNAYLFAVCVAAAAFFQIKIECSVIVKIDENKLMVYNSSAVVLRETDPLRKQLIRYGIRLLDFSRSNQLVHFRSIKGSSMGLVTGDIRGFLDSITRRKDGITRGNGIYLSGWGALAPKMVYRCKICGKMENFDYDSFEKSQSSKRCPECDKNNTNNRRSMEPLKVKERLTFFPADKYVCSCGKEIPVADLEKRGYICPKCRNPIEIKSAPIISSEKLREQKGKVFCVENKFTAEDTLHGMIGKAKNMSRNFGLHVLYLACGFLKWTDVSGTCYNSPILLCPVKLDIDKGRSEYYIEADNSASEQPFEVNKTLIQMLSSYSSTCSISLPELSGDNLNVYFSLVRKSFEGADVNIRSIVENWEIDESLGIGLFHYQKLQLHSDLEENADKYLEHPIVRRLCGDSVQIERVDTLERPSVGYMLLDADSSQEEVLRCAQEGQSFILQGPPGSGKSQTITNIIASSLGAGKTVLFVTEKASARSIIMDNLKRCKTSDTKGLTDFVLDFESFRTRGGAIGREPFVRELNRCLNLRAQLSADSAGLLYDEGERYRAIETFMRQARSIYGEKNYLSLLDGMAPFSSIRELYVSAHLVPDTTEEFFRLCNTLKGYYQAAIGCPLGINYREGILYGCKGDAGNTLYRAAVAYKSACERLKTCIVFLRAVGWNVSADKALIKKYAFMLKRWANMPALTDKILEGFGEKRVVFLISRAESRQRYKKELSEHKGKEYEGAVDRDMAIGLDVKEMTLQGARYSSPFKRVGKKYRAWCESILACFRSRPKKIKYYDVVGLLYVLKEYQDYCRQQELDCSQSRTDVDIFGFEPENREAWDKLISELKTAKKVIDDNDPSVFDIERNSAWWKRFERDVWEKTLQNLASLADSLDSVLKDEEREGTAIASYFDVNVQGTSYPPYAESAQEIISGKQYLLPLNRRYRALAEICSNNWLPVLDELIDEGEEDVSRMKDRLFKTYYINAISKMIEDNRLDSLRDFSRAGHERTMALYAGSRKKLMDSGAARICSKLQGNLDSAAGRISGKTSRKYPIVKSIAGYSIKHTISENWDYICRIKPCFMMSPLNVSQYIDVGTVFDVVIFDEASQIFTEDALASIVRGKQIIIAGDSKQLPPCDFFRAGESSQDEEGVFFEEDSNSDYSLLTSADKALPDASLALAWHYRSCDESLIHFANQAMDYNLITFPSAKHDPNDGVFYVSVPYTPEGCYVAGRGGSHTNPKEAEQIVELIYSEMTDRVCSKFSIGVVAFSNAQAFEIEAKWEEFKRKDSVRKAKIEQWEKAHEEEPLIFCNLDTVQGDERDTIIISVCYSKDKNGRFILPYLGRIRLESGKKRINVAVTRAKHRMIVVSMLDEQTLGEAIITSSAPEVNKAGANMLLAFLKYASKQGEGYRTAIGKAKNNIERSVCELLDEKNIPYDCQVGMSECKIDIAICNKNNKGDYCMGIIIDDPSRVDFDSVYEYSCLTEKILTEKYGWSLYRIYPASWIKDYEHEKTMLLKNVKEAMGET